MCSPECIRSVCEHATRRGLLKAGFTLGVGAVTATGGLGAGIKLASAQTRKPITFSQVHDMSHTLYEGFPTFSGDRWFEMEHPVTWEKDRVNLNRWTLMEHTGTHLDAPIHFSEDGMSADLIPIADLLCPLCVIDIRSKASEDADAYLTPEDILKWESEPPRVYRRVKLSKGEPHDRQETHPELHGRVPRARRSAFPRTSF